MEKRILGFAVTFNKYQGVKNPGVDDVRQAIRKYIGRPDASEILLRFVRDKQFNAVELAWNWAEKKWYVAEAYQLV